MVIDFDGGNIKLIWIMIKKGTYLLFRLEQV